jgi:hypothetical protein
MKKAPQQEDCGARHEQEPPPLSQEAPLHTIDNTDSVELERPLKTMTYFTKVLGLYGRERRVSISLPFVGCIADEPHYQAPPPPAAPQERGAPFAPRIGESKASRRRMEKALDRIGFERASRRIMRQGF